MKWLNGWPRLGVRHVLMGTSLRCVCCGRDEGITTVVIEPDWTPPPQTPEWPFTESECPLCSGVSGVRVAHIEAERTHGDTLTVESHEFR